VLHDFYTRFGKTKIFVQKKPEGYGLVCHRAIKTVCEVIGIRDLYAKVEGSTKNVQHVTKAFLVGLIRQVTRPGLFPGADSVTFGKVLYFCWYVRLAWYS